MAVTRGNERRLTPGITRVVANGARARNDLAIAAASTAPERPDTWQDRVADSSAFDPRNYLGPFARSQQVNSLGMRADEGWGGPSPQERGMYELQRQWATGNAAMADVIEWQPAPPAQWERPASVRGSGVTGPSIDPRLAQLNPGEIAQRNISQLNPGEIAAANAQRDAARQDAQRYADIIAQRSAEIDELNRMQLAAIQEGAMEIAAEYDEKINELKGRIADARQGLARSMEAFKHYSQVSQAAYQASVEAAEAGELAQVEALEGRAEAAAGKIEQGYDAATEDVEEVADLIGAGAMVLDDGLRGAVARFEGMMKEAARGRIEDVDRLSAAAAKFATAQAEAIKAQDAFMTDVEKEQVEIQIQSQIDAMLDNVQQLEKDKARAVQAALDKYDPMSADFDSPEEMWAYVFDNFVLSQGWSMEDEAEIRALMQQMDGVTNAREAKQWVAENLLPDIHHAVLTEFISKYRGPSQDGELAIWIQDLISNIVKFGPDSEQGYEAIGVLSRALRPDGVDLSVADVKAMFAEEEKNLDQLYDVFDLYEQHTKRWNEARAATAKSGGGRAGVNNYANRNDPQYVHRRNVGVPKFVNDFLAQFGKTGTGREFVGGVTGTYKGALRSPKLKGGGRASDSDHLSGGAIDLYGVTVAELEAIARWAQSHPGVASVVYWGNKYHETGKAGGASAGNNGRGHVHVSLKLGWP